MSNPTITRDSLPAHSPPGTVPGENPRAAGRLRWLPHALSSGLVVAALGSIAFWGHHTGWTIPKFSTLVGRGDAEAEAWCDEHNVLEAQCIECNQGLLASDTDYGWCQEHGVAQCPLHHPDVAETRHLTAVPGDLSQRAARALNLKPRLENNSRCLLYQRRIQFASDEAVEKVGVDIDVVVERPVTEAVVAYGEIVYDETCMAHLSSRVSGTVWQVERQVGDSLRQGDLLALVDAAEVGRAKAELQAALVDLRLKRTTAKRLGSLAIDGSVAQRQAQEAASALEDAEVRFLAAQQSLTNLGLPIHGDALADLGTDEVARRLQFLGLPEKLAAGLDRESTTSNLYPLRAPLDGVVVERNVVAGEVVQAAKRLFTVADVGRLWLLLDVRQEEVRFLSLGQQVVFRPNDDPAEAEIQGRLSWISTSADDQTRTVKVRVDLRNDGGRLQANTFGTGQIVLRHEPRAVVVPNEAVHWDGCCQVVFVRDKNYLEPDAPKFFRVRQVRTGVIAGGATEIIAGLLPGEVVAAKNSVVLEAQLLKNGLGAGCGCADGN